MKKKNFLKLKLMVAIKQKKKKQKKTKREVEQVDSCDSKCTTAKFITRYASTADP